MKEIVGNCTDCGKEVMCLDGFLHGVVDKFGALYCFNCAGQAEQESSNS
ncbi:hypothetical protein [Salibacterium salarium]|nr:hypothetical protein [Salibacterium salarium]